MNKIHRLRLYFRVLVLPLLFILSTLVPARASYNFSITSTFPMVAGEFPAITPIIDPVGGFVYFTSYTIANNAVTYVLIKIRLSDFTRVGTLTLNAGETITSTLIDPTAGFAYLVGNTVIKVKLSDLSRVSTLLTPSGYTSSTIDPAGGFAYFGNQKTITKVRLSDFTQVGTLTLTNIYQFYGNAVMDSAHGYAYFSAYSTTAGQIRRIRLSDFSDAGILESHQSGFLTIDSTDGFLYYITVNTTGPSLFKIQLSDFTEVDQKDIGGGTFGFIDPIGKFLYAGVHGSVRRINLTDLSIGPVLYFSSGQVSPVYWGSSVIYDPLHGFAYFGISSNPIGVYKILKIDVSAELTQTAGPSGTTLTWPRADLGLVQLTIPPLALSASTNITFEYPTNRPVDSNNLVGTGIVFKITPAISPAQLSMALSATYQDSEVTGFNKANLVFAVFNTVSNLWVPLSPSFSNMVINTVATNITQFGTFQLMASIVSSGNQPPSVTASVASKTNLVANLVGTATDDGLPNPPASVTTTWSLVSSAGGTVTFGNVHQLDTTATFSAAGNYVLRLSATDGELSSSADLSITVDANGTTNTTTSSTAKRAFFPARGQKGEISYTATTDGEATIQIYNALGEKVDQISHTQTAGPNTVIWDAHNLPAGIYRAVIEGSGQGKIEIKLAVIR